MKNLNKVLVLFVLLTLLPVEDSYSQSSAESNGYNPLSLRQVHESYLMWKKTLWRRVDLKEKQNKPFFARNREISKIIIEAVERGVLIPYDSDSVNDSNVMSREVFIENIQQADDDIEEEEGFDLDDPFAGFGEDDPFAEEVEEISVGPIYIPKREFSIFEIKEDLYFDRIHSRIYFDIQAITMYLPGDSFYNPAGFEKPIASFRFIDLFNLFKSMNKDAIWYNENNIAQHKNLGDAFLLRLFKGIIVKIANADDIRVSELYAKSRKEGIMASFKVEQDLMEWESNLWEY
ncbi:MAG: gliding motility protein GldN [Flammeovirgaceae bacterium]|nr:gliding motility protein GldN [Flammeovirgaceae bacterium]|tara:strand:- start:78472 stop:79341 length:870 start_codon:yes stop_codon:yes gene_type:complete